MKTSLFESLPFDNTVDFNMTPSRFLLVQYNYNQISRNKTVVSLEEIFQFHNEQGENAMP